MPIARNKLFLTHTICEMNKVYTNYYLHICYFENQFDNIVEVIFYMRINIGKEYK